MWCEPSSRAEQLRSAVTPFQTLRSAVTPHPILRSAVTPHLMIRSAATPFQTLRSAVTPHQTLRFAATPHLMVRFASLCCHNILDTTRCCHTTSNTTPCCHLPCRTLALETPPESCLLPKAAPPWLVGQRSDPLKALMPLARTWRTASEQQVSAEIAAVAPSSIQHDLREDSRPF